MQRRVVLIVAQDVDLRARMARSLGAAGYAVELAENARRAGELLSAGGLDVAVVVPDGLGPAGAKLVGQARDALEHVVVYGGSATTFDQHELRSRVAEALAAPSGFAESGAAPLPLLGFAGRRVDLDGRTFLDEGGHEVPLTHNEFALLSTFLRSPGRALSRERLRNAIAGEDLEAYERSIDMLVSRLRRKIEPDPKAPRFILTVPGAGYKFAAAVATLARQPASAAAAGTAAPDPPDKIRPVEPAPSSPPRLSIVVLPFLNIGGDPEQEYFADGITESLTTDLSRMVGSFVIGRSTAFTYKGKMTDLKQIGRDLNVRYVLEGSVQRGGNRLRVNVQLIDAESAGHLWAERFDKELSDLFDMQDEIVARLAGQLGAELIKVEARRAERSPDPDSMDLYFRGMACIHKGYTAEYLAQADVLLQHALALDPNNVDALAAKAWVDIGFAASFLSDDRTRRIAAAEAAAIKALSLAPNHAFAHFMLGTIYGNVNRITESIAECEHALALDPNLAYAHVMIGTAKTALGSAEEAEGHILGALRLSPRDVMAHHWMSSIGTGKLHLQKDDEAVVWLRRAIDANRNFAFTHFCLAAALVQLGRIDEARAAANAGLALESTFTIGRYRAGARSDHPVYLAARQRIYDALRKAGVPE